MQSAFGAPRLKNLAAISSGAPSAKPVGARPFEATWVKSLFHNGKLRDDGSRIRSRVDAYFGLLRRKKSARKRPGSIVWMGPNVKSQSQAEILPGLWISDGSRARLLSLHPAIAWSAKQS